MNFLNSLIVPTLIMSTLSLVASIVAVTLVMAQRWSTHRIEWKPLQVADPFKTDLPEEKEISDEDILEKALELQKRGKKLVDPLEEITETHNF